MVVPLGDRNPTRRAPFMTWALLVANVGVFFFVQPWMADTCDQLAFFIRHAAIPAELLQGSPLTADQMSGQATECGLAPPAGKNVYLAALSAMFLHANGIHLGGNMLYLWIFGANIEDRLGRLSFLLFYLGCGVVATASFVIANATSTSTLIGASGAVAGVLGAYFVLFPRARVTVWIPILLFVVIPLPAFVVLGFWFVLQLLPLQDAATAGGVAYLAHVVGFVTGAVAIVVTGGRPRRRRRRRSPRRR